MPTHTPGPWYVSDNRGTYSGRAVCADAAGGTIASISGGYDGQIEANARLIASAPDLLAACKEVLPRYVELFDHAGLGDPNESVAVEVLRAAIAKAEGDR